MTTYSKTIGTGGDYTTYSSWQSARISAAQSVSGDIEEAVFLDGVHTDSVGTISDSWPSGVIIRLKGQNSHNGDWSVSSGGAKLTSTATTGVISLNFTKPTRVEVENLVIVGASAASYVRAIVVQKYTELVMKKCLTRPDTTGGTSIYILNAIDNPAKVYVENCVLSKPPNNTFKTIYHTYLASSVAYVSCVGSFINGIGLINHPNGQLNYLELSGCLLSGAFEGGTVSRSAVDCIGTAAWTGWTTTHCSAATFVEGTPSVGQVGFTNFANHDFSLVDDDNNLAKDFVLTSQMPIEDVLGTSRPQGAYSDAGAYELFVQSSYDYFLPLFVT